MDRSIDLILNKFSKKKPYTRFKKIHGVGLKSIKKIFLIHGVFFSKKVVLKTTIGINNQLKFFYSLEKNKIYKNVEKKIKVKSYIGMRHILRLPVRGQRTHTNSNTPRKYIKKEIL